MILQVIDRDFSVYKVREIASDMMKHEFTFVGRTDQECSVISESQYAPKDVLTVDSGWKCFRIAEDASFEKYGMIAFLANIISAEKTSTLVVGTYDTDYLFIKKEKMEQVIRALGDNGCVFV